MTEYCKKMVTNKGGFYTHQCSRKARMDGYCKQHHPDTVEARDKKRHEKWDLENEITNLQYSLRSVGRECVDLVEKLDGKNREATKLVRRMNDIRKKIIKLRAKLEKYHK
jgi:predicted  nucleic acid-binding Zn-ribbon protein